MNTDYRYILETYQDRKKLKWLGFYLSDHTAQLDKENKELAFIWPQKPRLPREEIDTLLYLALIKNKTVVIQKEERDLEGHYPPDIIGAIKGFDSLGLYIDSEKINYDEIRHVQLLD